MKIRFGTQVFALFLVLVCTPVMGQFDTVHNIPPDEVPLTISSDTQINVFENGVINFGPKLEGFVSQNIEFNFFGGEVGNDVSLETNRINVLGGTFGNQCTIESTQANIENGTFGDNLFLGARSLVSMGVILGGQFGNGMEIQGGFVITGGMFNDVTHVPIIGSSFSNEIELQGGVATSLADGRWRMTGGTVVGEVNVDRLEISGGVVGGEVDASGTILNGGEIGGLSVTTFDTALINSGVVTNSVEVNSQGLLIANGGEVLGDLIGNENSESRINGGEVAGNYIFNAGSLLQLQGLEFQLINISTGQLIEDLSEVLQSLGDLETYEVTDRDVALVGVLGDGSSFRFELNSAASVKNDFASSQASIRIANFAPPFSGDVPIDSFQLFRGAPFPSNAFETDLAFSDDVLMRFNPGFTLGGLEAPVWPIFRSTLPNEISGLPIQFLIESEVGTPGLSKTFEFFNFTINDFQEISTAQASFNASEVAIIDVPDLKQFVSPDGEVSARVGWRQTGFIINFPWEVRIDHASWVLTE